MTDETMRVRTTIAAPAEAVFAILADPAAHAAIDGTGWVRNPADDGKPISEAGQVFRIAMYHDNHPDGDYEMANIVRVFDPPRAISWEPGQDDQESGEVETGGWIWRYDLAPAGPGSTEVTLTYDWSGATPEVRKVIPLPPFPVTHLENSLRHLTGLAGG